MRKCPKCKSKKITILESWKNHTIEWAYGTPYEEGVLEMGDPYRVDLTCEECNHTWKLRGAIQVSEDMFAPNKASTRTSGDAHTSEKSSPL